jgi:hypothetical protein
MAGERADILFRAELDASGAITSLQKFEGQATATSERASSGAAGLAARYIGLTAVLGGLYAVLKTSIGAAMEAEQADARLGAVLKATGDASGTTAERIKDFASRMQALVGVDDEVIKSAAAVGLTFESLRGKAFEPAMKAAMDLSAVFGTDLQSNVQLLGKALEDPVQGLTLLRRSAIIFTEAEKDLIKTLAEHNRLEEARAVILDKVNAKVGGAARVLGETFGGQLKILRATMMDSLETTGAWLLKITGIPEAVKKAADQIRALQSGKAFAGPEDELLTPRTLGLVAKQRREVEAAANAQAAAQMKLITLSEEEKKKLQALLESYNPYLKAQREHAENVKLLDQASKAGEISQTQYNSAIKASADALEAARDKTGQLLLELKPIIVDVAAAFKEWDAANPQKLPQGYSLTPWIKYYQGIADEAEKGLTKPMEGIGDESSRIFGEAFKDGFLAVMEGKDFTDPMKLLFGGLAGMFAQMLGDQIQSVMSTGKIDKEALKKAGVLTAEGKLSPGTAAMMLGGLLGTIGGAQGNRGLATFGGAISGAGAGFMMAGGMGAAAGVGAGAASGAAAGSAFPVWGTIIGAVVGAALAYFGSGGPSKETAELGLRGGRGYVTEITGGVNKEAEAIVAQQITDRYQSAVMGIRGVLRILDADITKVPAITLKLDEKSKNIQSAIDAFIKGTVPKAVLSAYKPALEGALTAIGIGADRIKSELAAFDSTSFDQALLAFARWVAAFVDLGDTAKLLQKTPDELRAEVNRTMREGFLAGIDDVLKKAGEMADETSQLFSKEQVENAENLIALGKQQYDTTLNYISQLESVSKNIDQLVSGVLLGFEEKRAATGGPESLGAFYQRQLEALQARLAGATSGEQVNEIMAQMAKFAQALGDLGLAGIFGGGAATPWGEAVVGSQEWVEQYLKQQQAIGDALIAEWEKEAADRNALLADVMEAQRLALAAATDAAGSLGDGLKRGKDGLDDLGDAAIGAADLLRGMTDSLAAMRQEVDGLAGALAGLGGGGGAGPESARRYA